jgi:hypothetical protein
MRLEDDPLQSGLKVVGRKFSAIEEAEKQPIG